MDLETRCNSRRKEGHGGGDLRSVVSTHDMEDKTNRQHHGPQLSKTCIHSPVGLPIEDFVWSELGGGGHKIHRAGRSGSAPPSIRFRTVLFAAKASPGGKHPNQQDERRRKEGNPRPNEACTARASDRVCACV